MREKITIEECKEHARIHNGKCLSTKYENVNSIMKWECQEGHLFDRSFNNMKYKNAFCSVCDGHHQFTIEQCQQFAKDKNGFCLSKEYKNNMTHLSWQCKKGHVFENTFATMKKRKHSFCPVCDKHTFEEVKELCNKVGLVCLEGDYRGFEGKHKVICEKGHITYKVFRDLLNLTGCGHKECKGKKVGDALRHDGEKVIKYLEEKCNLICLNHNYVNARTKLKWKCNKDGYEFESATDSLKGAVKRGTTGCPYCAGQIIDTDYLKEKAEEYGGKFLQILHKDIEHYKRAVVQFECKEKHLFTISTVLLKRGYWCPECSSSLGERIARAYFEQIFNASFPKVRPDWLRNPKTNAPLELDGFNPDIKTKLGMGLAFEHQGEQHYSSNIHLIRGSGEEHLKDIRHRDNIKIKTCKEKGVALIIIPEIFNRLKLGELKYFLKNEFIKNNVKLPNNYDDIQFNINNIYVSKGKEFIDRMQKVANELEGKLIDITYKGSERLHEFECKEGHRFFKKAKEFLSTHSWCPICNGGVRKDLNFLKELAEKLGIKSLSTEYLNRGVKYLWECEKGHQWEDTAKNIKQKIKKRNKKNDYISCPICKGEKKNGNR